MKRSMSSLVAQVALAVALLPVGALAANQGHGNPATGQSMEESHESVTAERNEMTSSLPALPIKADHDITVEATESTSSQHFELRGNLTAVTSTSLSANGQTIMINAGTHVVGTPIVDSFIHAEGTDRNGTLVATEVNVMPVNAKGTPPSSFRLSGDEPEVTAVAASNAGHRASVSTAATGHQSATDRAGLATPAATTELSRLSQIFDRILAFLKSLFHA